MPSHPNFYESIAEARMRLDGTIVLYEDEPCLVLTVCDHKPDGIFRVYLDPLVPEGHLNTQKWYVPVDWYDEPGMNRGQRMDKWMEEQGGNTVLRKMMNSPKFKKFRPFSLGMANHDGTVSFVERIPTRHTQQGLMSNMLTWSTPDVFRTSKQTSGRARLGGPAPDGKAQFPFLSSAMYHLIKGNYPSVEECIKNLNDPSIENSSVAFAREFAFVRGPLGLIFLAYKSDIIGYLPNSDLSMVKIDTDFSHAKEVVDELGVFSKIF